MNQEEDSRQVDTGERETAVPAVPDWITIGVADSLDGELAAALRGRLERLFGLLSGVSQLPGRGRAGSDDEEPRDLLTVAKGFSLAAGEKLLILTRLPLTSGAGSPVWGAAELGGKRALLSLSPFGISEGPAHQWRMVFRRVLREAAHELGHLFGLEHCSSVGCIMQVRPARVDDDSRVGFCPDCEERLHQVSPTSSCTQGSE